MSILDLIRGAEKYAPIAKFVVANRDKEADLVVADVKALDVIAKADPTLIPHIEALSVDLVKAAGAPPVAPGENVDPPHVVAKHIVARALVAPSTVTPDEERWMARASASSG
jgi:hypothetical protein